MAETPSETLTPLTAAPAPYIDILRTVFPVVAVQPEESGQIARPDFFGTASTVAPGLFMPAAHVVTEAPRMGTSLSLDLGHLLTMLPMGSATVTQVEVFRDRDTACCGATPHRSLCSTRGSLIELRSSPM
jgi:hypothetical protein